MANPGGTNQFQGFGTELPYGDKKRQGMLERIAPKAGQAQAASALQAPRRDQRHAAGQDAAAGEQAAGQSPSAQPSPQAVSQALVDAVSRVPGITPVWGELG